VIDVSEIVGDPDFVQPITLRRPTATMSGGVERTTHDDSTIQAVVQPADVHEISLLPEGARLGNIIAVYSTTEIRVSPQAQDIVIVDEMFYRAIKSEPWGSSGYFVAFCEGYQPS
jgi:hypothetical protein